MDLFKAYDYLPQNILIAKLQAYWGNYNIVTFALVYLTSIKQRTKIATLIATGQKFFREYHKASSQTHYCSAYLSMAFSLFFWKIRSFKFRGRYLTISGKFPKPKNILNSCEKYLVWILVWIKQGLIYDGAGWYCLKKLVVVIH